jgi:peptidoglycan hydrolase-like protein with peptidoglycan-binding domain
MLPVGEDFFPKPPGGFDDVYNAKTENAVEVFQRFVDIVPASGQFGQRTLDEMWAYADAYSKWVYRTWTAPKPKPTPPELVEPYQGFGSLHRSLWEAYSLGRHMGLRDGLGLASGTYNPNSKLPSGARSDHAYLPSYAFDLDIGPDTGWQNDTARAFFYAMVGRPEVNYVILGDRIWSRAYANQGVRLYGGGGHMNHIHVSAVH